MAHASGSALFVSFKGVTMSGDQTTFDWSSSIKTIDTTAGADAADSHITGTYTGEASFERFYENSSAGSTLERELYEGNSGTLLWGVEGTASGKPKHGIVATITGVDRAAPYDDALKYNVTWTFNGAWLFNRERNGDSW